MPLARALPGLPRTTLRRDMPMVRGHGPCHLAAEPDASRGDSLALADLLTRTGHAAIRAILALNRVYLPHRQLKWQRHLTAGLSLVPGRLAERLESLSNGRPGEALQAAEALLAETVTLAEAHSDAGIGAFREALSERRQAIAPPQPGT